MNGAPPGSYADPVQAIARFHRGRAREALALGRPVPGAGRNVEVRALASFCM